MTELKKKAHLLLVGFIVRGRAAAVAVAVAVTAAAATAAAAAAAAAAVVAATAVTSCGGSGRDLSACKQTQPSPHARGGREFVRKQNG